ncbi:prolyl endopeptidase isoform X2 [Anoplophora glabripennis]|nr:prolyl endopeptidase isoform X2 [Anoplophora glabripennis]
MSFKYPEARRDESVKDDYFGVQIADPYRWLEDPDSKETQEFVQTQNEITKPYLNGCAYKDKIKDKVTQLWNYPKYSIPFRHGNKYYQYRNSGLQNQSVIFVQESLKDEAKVFLDPNTFSEDGTVALSGTAFSEDGKTFAYGLSASGSDWIEIKFKNVQTGKDYDEVLKKVKYSPMTWMHDNKGFFYGAYLDQTGKADGSETKSNKNQKLYYHQLGTDQSKDIMAVEFDDEQLRMGAHVSHCGNYLIVTPIKGCKNNLLYFTKFQPDKTVTKKLELTPIVTEFNADYEYVTNTGTKFVFLTNKNAPNSRLIVIDIENYAELNWVDLVKEHPKDVLHWAHIINNNMLVLCYLKDVKNVMAIHDLKSGKKIYDFKLDVGSISAVSGKYFHKEMFFSFCSFLTPNIIHKVDFDGDKISESVIHETKVGDFNPSLYQTEQVFFKSKDGTNIPMFIVSKKGLVKDGSKCCLLYGYGGFNINLTPFFGVSSIIFINNFDGVFALANIRGGGEYGEKWHNGGRFDKKQNCFDDFQYAAKYLVNEKYTSVNKLTIQGGSNGGLLVAACVNQAPDLFGAAICQVGVLDMLRYHKFTIGYAWTSDYGSSEEEEQFRYLIKYSPLHSIQIPKEGSQYPATLLLTADHDDRVVPLHSLKFIAELQNKVGKLPQQKNPLMVRIETKAGHGAGKPTSKLIEEVTDYYCFISRALNLKFLD